MFDAAARSGVKLKADKIAANAARRKAASPISIHKFDLIKNRFRAVRSSDFIHQSVVFCKDDKDRQHNNPPVGCCVVSDAGVECGKFAGAASGQHAG